MATVTPAEIAVTDVHATPDAVAVNLPLIAQLRKFLWLASGMFSVSALALAFGDYWVVGSAAQAETHFVAAILSAALFGLATFLKLGPSEA